MSQRIEFPNEPIRVPPAFGPQPFEGYTTRELADEDLGDPYECLCQTCGGDGFVFCDGGTDCPEADDAGCPFADSHAYTCTNCGGSGDAKDQRFW